MNELSGFLASNLRKQMDFSYIWQQISHFPVVQKTCSHQLLFIILNARPWSGGLTCVYHTFPAPFARRSQQHCLSKEES